ncbi:4a-hydroxytetrahydrobiopterin dehydratase [Saccharicrinis carchari]|nr:4a-hydroxytetrahydrobiopterin dehydratase [Saccharicrinis carchari]
MKDLKKKHCVPCEGEAEPLNSLQINDYIKNISPEWKVIDNKKIRREFTLKDFKGSMAFINTIAPIAEEEDHHPDIHVYYKEVIIELTTHAIGGLSENDFILAAKIDDVDVSGL